MPTVILIGNRLRLSRRKARNITCVADFDPSTPSIARVYDYFLGGRDNFAADRELAQRLINIFPPIPVTVRENKQFLERAITWAAREGIGQFIDVGCGLPTTPSTHGSARVVNPDARVAYVDTDQIVLSHLRGLPAREQVGLTIVDGDARDVDKVLAAVSDGLDLSVPSCLIMAALLHFFPVETGRDLVARYAAALAPGSCVVLTMGLADGAAADRFFNLYSKGPSPLYKHSAEDFASFFGDLPLLPPGVADARSWRPGWPLVSVPPKREGEMIVGVAQVP
jgi:O-methyltransferase involved in polyketide biosynthesis